MCIGCGGRELSPARRLQGPQEARQRPSVLPRHARHDGAAVEALDPRVAPDLGALGEPRRELVPAALEAGLATDPGTKLWLDTGSGEHQQGMIDTTAAVHERLAAAGIDLCQIREDAAKFGPALRDGGRKMLSDWLQALRA